VYAERIARVGTPKLKATWQPNEIQIEVNTAPRKPEGWQGYFDKKWIRGLRRVHLLGG
jgi:hypothetical protein